MADTQRSTAYLLSTLFQDGQPAGSISPQDMRDLIVSIGEVQYAGCGVTGNTTETVITVAGTFVKMAGVTAEESSSSNFTLSDNRLTYIGAEDVIADVTSVLAITSPSSSQITVFCIAKGGVPVGTQIHRKIGTGSDVGALSIATRVTLSTNDYVEVWAANDTSTANILANDLYLSATAHVI